MVNDIILLPLVYESCILVIAVILNLLIIKRHQSKKSQLTFLLTLQFVFYLFAIIFSWLGKFIQYLYSDFPTGLSPTSEYFISLIWDIRAALAMITVGIIFSHRFKIEIFEAKFKDSMKNKLLTVLGIGIFITTFALYNRENSFYTLIVYGLVFLYDLIIYISMMGNGLYLSKRIEDPIYRKAIHSITFMAWCFIAIFLCFLLDQIVAITTGWAYNIFYYLAWMWAVLAIGSSYLGYLKPSEVN